MSIDDWAQSGLAALTGTADGPADMSRAPVLAQARTTLAEFAASIESVMPGAADRLSGVDAGDLLSGRAALNGYRRRGRISAGGGTRILAAHDGWIALTLSRDADRELVPALLSEDLAFDDPWAAVTTAVSSRSAAEFVERARLLGLPAAVLGEAGAEPPRIVARGIGTPGRRSRLLVVDLSSLWAGPLCGQLLLRAGAQVVKVESPQRPDGARRGNRTFFDWMNGGKLSCAIDFSRQPGRIAALLERADVVIEASRPRTLRRHGLASDQLVPRPGQVWLRLTAHGATEPGADWVGFGDDAAVAGGLVGRSAQGPVFIGDAIADPLTGLEAARLIAESLRIGGGQMIDVSLAGTAARYAALGTASGSEIAGKGGRAPRIAAPRFRSTMLGPGPELGADDAVVERLIDDGPA